MAHQAGAYLGHDRSVAVAIAAGLIGDPQVTGIQEADELGRFPIQRRVCAGRVRGSPPEGAITRHDVSSEFVGSVGLSPVTIRAGQMDGRGCMHGLDPDVALLGVALGEGWEDTS